jgi:hypothetical protein
VHLLCWCSAGIKSHLSLGKNQLSGTLLLVTMKVMVERSFFVFCLFKYDVIFKITIEFKQPTLGSAESKPMEVLRG